MAIEVWRPRTPVMPFRLLDEMERNMEEFMERPFSRQFRRLWRTMPGDGMGFAPDIEILEKPDKLIVRMDVPGVKKEDIDISVAGSTLTVKGERKKATEIKEEEYQQTEVSYGRFLRSVTLAEDVDPNRIEANLKDGVLEILLPKVEPAKPTKIEIKAKT